MDNWETKYRFISWLEFYDTLQRFTHHSTSGPLGDLAKLKQKGISKTFARAPRVSRQDQIELFTTELSPTLSVEVRRDRPRNLANAIGLAREAEQREDLLLDKVAQATRSRQTRSMPWASRSNASASTRPTTPSSSTLPAAIVGSKPERGRVMSVLRKLR